MEQISEYVDRRHIGSCIYCGNSLFETEISRDHVPSKSLLTKPYPENLPTVEVHTACNRKYSRDEEYVAACLSAVLSGSTRPDDQIDERAGKTLARSAGLRETLERSKTTYKTRAGQIRSVWDVDVPRFSSVVLKNARGHAVHEYGEPFYRSPDAIEVSPLEHLSAEQRDEFEAIPQRAAWPEIGSRMMTRIMSGQDMSDGWIIVQDGVYRYAVFTHDAGVAVRIVAREYMAAEVVWS